MHTSLRSVSLLPLRRQPLLSKAFSPTQISRSLLDLCHKFVSGSQTLEDRGDALGQSPCAAPAVDPWEIC